MAKTPNTPIVNTGKQESVLFNAENLIMMIAGIIVLTAIIIGLKLSKSFHESNSVFEKRTYTFKTKRSISHV